MNDFEPEKHEKIEKAKARELRNSRWWQQKIAKEKCHYCGNAVTSETATIDHVIPISRGGKSEKNNIVVSCKNCNTAKKNKLPDGFSED